MSAPSFEEFCNDYRQFRAIVGDVLEKADNGPLKQQLAEVIKFTDEQFNNLLEAYPQAMAELEAQREALRQKQAELERRRALLKELTAQAAAEPTVARAAKPSKQVAIEVVPSFRLREELLARFGRPKSDDDGSTIREAWEDWDWHHDPRDGRR